MSYFVVVTFDIKDSSPVDYTAVYQGFANIGLSQYVTTDQGKRVDLPTTTTAGTFDGNSADELRDSIRNKAESVFKSNDLHGKIFVTVGANWAWGSRTP